MTKETKIGLLVGVGMILFICILVSDMLSGSGEPASPAPGSAAGPSGDPYNDPSADPGGEELLADLTRPLPEPERSDESGGNPGNGGPGHDRDGRGRNIGGHSLSSTRPFEPHIIVNNTDPGESTAGGASSDGFIFHHVQRGESPWSIAEKHYGDGEYYRVIYEHNRDKMPSADSVREGVTLRLPKRHEARDGGQAERADAASSDRGAATVERSRTGDDASPAVAATVEHVVQSGETLSELAQRYYGTVRAMPKLLELNRDRIDDADSLRVGQKIRVPATSNR